MLRLPGAHVVMVASALASGASAAYTQSTPVDDLERQRAEKSSQLRPNEPICLEGFITAMLRAFHPHQPEWPRPLTAGFRPMTSGFALVGLDR